MVGEFSKAAVTSRGGNNNPKLVSPKENLSTVFEHLI